MVADVVDRLVVPRRWGTKPREHPAGDPLVGLDGPDHRTRELETGDPACGGDDVFFPGHVVAEGPRRERQPGPFIARHLDTCVGRFLGELTCLRERRTIAQQPDQVIGSLAYHLPLPGTEVLQGWDERNPAPVVFHGNGLTTLR